MIILALVFFALLSLIFGCAVYCGRRTLRHAFARAFPALVLLWLTACAASDKATIYTEEGLRSAEQGWDDYYNREGDRCEKLHEPKTPQMEACFGKTYDADAAVAIVVQSAVALLQGYWRRRAAGEKPDIAQVLKEVQALIDSLPPEAKQYFDRVRGIP